MDVNLPYVSLVFPVDKYDDRILRCFSSFLTYFKYRKIDNWIVVGNLNDKEEYIIKDYSHRYGIRNLHVIKTGCNKSYEELSKIGISFGFNNNEICYVADFKTEITKEFNPGVLINILNSDPNVKSIRLTGKDYKKIGKCNYKILNLTDRFSYDGNYLIKNCNGNDLIVDFIVDYIKSIQEQIYKKEEPKSVQIEDNKIKSEVKISRSVEQECKRNIHSKEENKEKYKTIYKQNDIIKDDDNTVTVAMTTYPQRGDSYVQVINQLLPQCDRLCICFNGYNNIPSSLPKSNKIIAIVANDKNGIKDMGCNNKMYWIGKYNGYYATVDDDIIYPNNYISELKKKIKEYNDRVIVSFHGTIFSTKNGKINTKDKKVYYFWQHRTNDILCHKVGMGVAMCKPKKLGLDSSIYINTIKNLGDDEITAVTAQIKHLPLICINTNNIKILNTEINNRGLSTDIQNINIRNKYIEMYDKWILNNIDIYNKQNNIPQTQESIKYVPHYEDIIETQTNDSQERIIVSMTSWFGRINNVITSINSILDNTIKPFKIILNLSSNEFKYKEKQLPKELLELQIKNKIDIFWVKENTKPYKKILPTLLRFPKDIIISIDDDIIYPSNFIENLYNTYLYYDKQCPITAGKCFWENGIFSHYGGYSLVKKEFFGDYLFDIYNNLVEKNPEEYPFSDLLFTYSALLNNRRYKFTWNMDMYETRMKTYTYNDSISKLGDRQYKYNIQKEHKLIQNYIYNRYKKTYQQLFDSDIIVNITTYPKRDKFLQTTLKSLQKQSLKATKIILWLSEEEYDKNNLPITIQSCIDNKLLTDIEWVHKNTYCHKRHDCFKKYNDSYNLCFDDDIVYPENFIYELVNKAKKYQNCIAVMASNEVEYNGYELKKLNTLQSQISLKNNFMGGRNCFPPYVIPCGIFYDSKLNTLRDIYVKKCDEAWIRAFSLRFKIPIYILHRWCEYKFDTISETQEMALYNENKQYLNYNNIKIREKERNFFNAIKILHVEKVAKRLWPKINIDNYELF